MTNEEYLDKLLDCALSNLETLVENYCEYDCRAKMKGQCTNDCAFHTLQTKEQWLEKIKGEIN